MTSRFDPYVAALSEALRARPTDGLEIMEYIDAPDVDKATEFFALINALPLDAQVGAVFLACSKSSGLVSTSAAGAWAVRNSHKMAEIMAPRPRRKQV